MNVNVRTAQGGTVVAPEGELVHPWPLFRLAVGCVGLTRGVGAGRIRKIGGPPGPYLSGRSPCVFGLVLVLLLVWFVLSVVLLAWTLFFQGYIYSEPADDLWWRAPAAGTALLAFLLLWVFLDFRSVSVNPKRDIGLYRELQSFSFTEDEEAYPELIVPRDGKEETYKRKKIGGRYEYVTGSGQRLPSRPADKIIAVSKDGQRDVFVPDKENGHFKVGPNESLRYRDDRGREMVEGYLGQVSTRHYTWLLTNLLLNFLHLVVWFLGLWLLLRYQWAHALGLAVVFWGVTTLFVLPQVLGQAEKVARSRAAAPVEARLQGRDGYESCVFSPTGRRGPPKARGVASAQVLDLMLDTGNIPISLIRNDHLHLVGIPEGADSSSCASCLR